MGTLLEALFAFELQLQLHAAEDEVAFEGGEVPHLTGELVVTLEDGVEKTRILPGQDQLFACSRPFFWSRASSW